MLDDGCGVVSQATSILSAGMIVTMGKSGCLIGSKLLRSVMETPAWIQPAHSQGV